MDDVRSQTSGQKRASNRMCTDVETEVCETNLPSSGPLFDLDIVRDSTGRSIGEPGLLKV